MNAERFSDTPFDPATTGDDDRLLAELRETIDSFDPVPDRLIESARAAFVWRTIDEDLARLEFDSLAGSDVLVRSGDAVHLSFATSEASVEVEVGSDGLVGQVVPPAGEVRLVTASGERHREPCDDDGQFRFVHPGAGPVRLVASLANGDVVTEWFTI